TRGVAQDLHRWPHAESNQQRRELVHIGIAGPAGIELPVDDEGRGTLYARRSCQGFQLVDAFLQCTRKYQLAPARSRIKRRQKVDGVLRALERAMLDVIARKCRTIERGVMSTRNL